MREVDLMGFSSTPFFVTYRKRRFSNWIGVKEDLIPVWLKETCFDPYGQTHFKCKDYYFETGGRVPPNLRNPLMKTFRWHIFLRPGMSGSQSRKTQYVGSLHSSWIKRFNGLEFDDIEFCLLPSHRNDLRDALRPSFLMTKLKASAA